MTMHDRLEPGVSSSAPVRMHRSLQRGAAEADLVAVGVAVDHLAHTVPVRLLRGGLDSPGTDALDLLIRARGGARESARRLRAARRSVPPTGSPAPPRVAAPPRTTRQLQIGRAHVCTPVTPIPRMPSSA